jgi:hypothetical protein
MSNETLTYSDFDDPPEAGVHVVDSGLERHNCAVAPLSDVRPLASFASDARSVVGGAGTNLQVLRAAPAYRTKLPHQGIATRPLQFEQRAAGRGCSVFYLTTLSFQAPEFYRKRGYASIAEISGYPEGITKHLMHKETRP